MKEYQPLRSLLKGGSDTYPSHRGLPLKWLLASVVAVISLILLIVSWSPMRSTGNDGTLYSWTRHTNTSALEPTLSVVSTTFDGSTEFAAPPPSDGRAEPWDIYLDGTRGFIEVPDHAKYGLPRGFRPDNDPDGIDTYAVSAMHQLHCLAMIRKAYYHSPVTHDTSSPTTHGDDPDMAAKHLDHCFDYIRQGIMCAADTTLEWSVTHPGALVDGWGITHQCRDWNGFVEWQKKKKPQ